MGKHDDLMNMRWKDALAAYHRKMASGDRLSAEAERLGIDLDAPPQVMCQTCCDKGVVSFEVAQDDERFGKLYPCPNPQCPTRRRHLQERQVGLVKYAQIPSHYQGFTFQSWLEAASHRNKKDNWFYDFAVQWVESPGHYVTMSGKYLDGGKDAVRNGLIFAGNYGVGKTGLMIAMAHALIERNEQPLYIRAMDYVKLRYKTYRRESDDEDDDAVDIVQAAPILMLDDFNVSNRTDNMQDVIEDLVRFRHGRDLPTVITCNYSIPELEALWGKRSVSALLEACHWIPVGGEPLRDTRQLGGGR